MKRNISDLLDSLQVHPIYFESDTPLSPSRIKEKTMSKVKEKTSTMHRVRIRMFIAAAVILALTISTVAAEELFGAGDFFRDILYDRLKEKQQLIEENGQDISIRQSMTDRQMEMINQMGQVYHESVTSEGTTIIPIAGYGDENVFYLRLKVEGPKGSVLPDGLRYTFYGNWEQRDAVFEKMNGLDQAMWTLPDEDPTDHVKEFLIQITVNYDSQEKLNDGSPFLYHIYGLYRLIPEEGYSDTYEQILPGDFVIDLSCLNRIEMVELDVEGIGYHRSEKGTLIDLEGESVQIPYDYTVTLSSLKISPLSVCWSCSYERSDPTWKVNLDIQVVLKDGTVVPHSGDISAGMVEDNGRSYFETEGMAVFDVPVDLDEVAYILIGEEEKVFFPE